MRYSASRPCRLARASLQPIDEVDHGVEAAPGAAADAGPRNSYCQMRLAGAGSADQHRIALFGEKGAARQIADLRLVDRRAGEVEVVDVLGQRQLGDGQLIFDRARLLFGDLGAEQIANDARRFVPALDAGGHHLVIGRSHPVELEARHQLENFGALHQELSAGCHSERNRRLARVATAVHRGSGSSPPVRGHGAATGC